MSDRLDEFSAWQLKQLIEAGSVLVTCVGFDKLVSTAEDYDPRLSNVIPGLRAPGPEAVYVLVR